MKYYSGIFRPKNPQKYCGSNLSNIVYRSHWEKQVCKFLDENDSVLSWSSESIVIPYRCKTDNAIHRYFVDIYFETSESKFLIEIKPKSQTKPPKKSSKRSKKHLNEVMSYMKNISKWDAAKEYAEARGWIFEVWTEDNLRDLGIKIL